jgi:hypothetical protein
MACARVRLLLADTFFDWLRDGLACEHDTACTHLIEGTAVGALPPFLVALVLAAGVRCPYVLSG